MILEAVAVVVAAQRTITALAAVGMIEEAAIEEATQVVQAALAAEEAAGQA